MIKIRCHKLDFAQVWHSHSLTVQCCPPVDQTCHCGLSFQGGLPQQQLSGQIRPAALGQTLGQLSGSGLVWTSRQPPPPQGQEAEGPIGQAVPSLGLGPLSGAPAETQRDHQQGGFLLWKLCRQPEKKRVWQGIWWWAKDMESDQFQLEQHRLFVSIRRSLTCLLTQLHSSWNGTINDPHFLM